MKTKKVIQRNLPLDTRYTFVSAKYISVFDGGGCCENCGKIISNIVTVKSTEGRYYNIGSDCADTLTSLKEDVNYLLNGNPFAEGKRIRAKLTTNYKKAALSGYHFYTSTDGQLFIVYEITRGGSGMERINSPEITQNYIKDIPQKRII